MLVEGRTTVERNPILPILKITMGCKFDIMPILLSKIVEYSESAEEFGGRMMDSEQYPELLKGEILAVSIQLIFQTDGDLEDFRNQKNL